MMEDGLVDDTVKMAVLCGLEPLVASGDSMHSNGDIKEREKNMKY